MFILKSNDKIRGVLRLLACVSVCRLACLALAFLASFGTCFLILILVEWEVPTHRQTQRAGAFRNQPLNDFFCVGRWAQVHTNFADVLRYLISHTNFGGVRCTCPSPNSALAGALRNQPLFCFLLRFWRFGRRSAGRGYWCLRHPLVQASAEAKYSMKSLGKFTTIWYFIYLLILVVAQVPRRTKLCGYFGRK